MTEPMQHPAAIAERINALDEATKLSENYLSADRIEDLRAVIARANGRLRHGTHHTVIALAGPTGAGKSTLFNALIGEQVSAVGVRRPTTSKAHACVFGDHASAGDLLDWLEIGQRFHREAGPDLDGLILVDLPDHDSTQESNRMEVDRLVELVDLMVWVTDPQKYADHALHVGYLRPLASHASVMRFVLSKADTLDAASLAACIKDFTSLLDDDGIADAVVVATSIDAASPDPMRSAGTDAVYEILAGEVASQQAIVDRLSADIGSAVDEHFFEGKTLDDGTAALEVQQRRPRDERSAHRHLIESLGKAAGVQRAADTVADQHRHEAHLSTGWPLTRWVSRWKRRPIRDLPVARTSTVASAEVGLALRAAGEAAASGLDGPWAPALRRRAEEQHDDVLAALDTVSHRTISDHRNHPRWWSVVGAIQRLLVGAVIAGVIWLFALALVDGFFRIDVDLAAPNVGELPLPTLMVFGGVVVGFVLALLSRIFARIGARRRSTQVRNDLEVALEQVAQTHIHGPLSEAISDRDRIFGFANIARGAQMQRAK